MKTKMFLMLWRKMIDDVCTRRVCGGGDLLKRNCEGLSVCQLAAASIWGGEMELLLEDRDGHREMGSNHQQRTVREGRKAAGIEQGLGSVMGEGPEQ